MKEFRECVSCKNKSNKVREDEPCIGCVDGSEWKQQDEIKDNINPDHYKNSTSLECIDAMKIAFGPQAVIDFCICNAWKYIWRWKHKNGIEDLHKADWYVMRARTLIHIYGTPLKGEYRPNEVVDRLKGYISTEIIQWEAEHEQKESN